MPVGELLSPPLKLPLPRDVPDDQRAQELLDEVEDRLFEIGIVVDACDHFSPRELYRYVFEHILRDGTVHPDLASTGGIEHYTTWQCCVQCIAEFDAEIEL